MPYRYKFFVGLPYFPSSGLSSSTSRHSPIDWGKWKFGGGLFWWCSCLLRSWRPWDHSSSVHTQADLYSVRNDPVHATSAADTHPANCSPSPTFVSREHKFVYYTAASDIVTDVMRMQGKQPDILKLFLMCPRSDLHTCHYTSQIILRHTS